MKIYIGSDHAGFKLKEKLKPFLIKYKVQDLGNLIYNKNDDYPVYGLKVAKAVSKNKNSIGILVCGSGQGVAIAANKVKGIRAAVAENVRDAFLAKNDDNVNVICLPGRYTKLILAKKIINKFLETKFSKAKRFTRRVNEIKKIEKP